MNGPGEPPPVARSASALATGRMSRLLRSGLLLSAAVVLVGLVRALIEGGSLQLGQLATATNRAAFDPSAIASGLLAGSAPSIIALGLLILVATPVARVALGAYSFSLERDPLLVRATIVVLALLLLGLFVIGPLLR